MRLNKTIYLSAVALSMAASAVLTSCNNEPEPIPAEEIYLRNFIMKYGLIDPEQDWNMATSTSLTLVSDGIPRDVNVLVNCGGTLRRVGEFRNVRENININNMDIPSFADVLYVESNGEIMEAELNSTVMLAKYPVENSSSPSYAQSNNYEDMAWIIAAEDLGATDDMDFNDIVFRMESVAVNFKGDIGASEWQVVDDDEWIDITGKHQAPASREDDNDPTKLTSKRLKITALASGGTLPLYLHYRLSEVYDYIIGYNKDGSSMKSVDNLSDESAKALEWHRWFGFDRDDIMINTGLPVGGTTLATGEHAALGIATVYVDDSFTMKNYCYVDYDDDKTGPIKENWEWATGDYTKYNIQGFYITVGGYKIENCRTALYASHKGAAPQMFLIPDAGPEGTLWHWPTERTDITNVYPDFRNWVANVNNSDWFCTYKSDAKEGVHYMRK